MASESVFNEFPELEQTFGPLLQEKIKEALDLPPDKLLDPRAKEAQIRQKFYEELQKDLDKLTRGMELFIEQFNSLDFSIFSRLDDENLIADALERGESIQDILGLSDDQMKEFYSYGCELFRERLFEDASDYFYLLTYLNLRIYEFWFAYGLVEQNLEHWDRAINCFRSAVVLKPKNPRTYLHIAYCSQQKEEYQRIELYLALLKGMITDPSDLAPYQEQLEYFREVFSSHT